MSYADKSPSKWSYAGLKRLGSSLLSSLSKPQSQVEDTSRDPVSPSSGVRHDKGYLLLQVPVFYTTIKELETLFDQKMVAVERFNALSRTLQTQYREISEYRGNSRSNIFFEGRTHNVMELIISVGNQAKAWQGNLADVRERYNASKAYHELNSGLTRLYAMADLALTNDNAFAKFDQKQFDALKREVDEKESLFRKSYGSRPEHFIFVGNLRKRSAILTQHDKQKAEVEELYTRVLQKKGDSKKAADAHAAKLEQATRDFEEIYSDLSRWEFKLSAGARGDELSAIDRELANLDGRINAFQLAHQDIQSQSTDGLRDLFDDSSASFQTAYARYDILRSAARERYAEVLSSSTKPIGESEESVYSISDLLFDFGTARSKNYDVPNSTIDDLFSKPAVSGFKESFLLAIQTDVTTKAGIYQTLAALASLQNPNYVVELFRDLEDQYHGEPERHIRSLLGALNGMKIHFEHALRFARVDVDQKAGDIFHVLNALIPYLPGGSFKTILSESDPDSDPNKAAFRSPLPSDTTPSPERDLSSADTLTDDFDDLFRDDIALNSLREKKE